MRRSSFGPWRRLAEDDTFTPGWRTLSPKGSEKLSKKLSIEDGLKGLESSLDGSTGNRPKTKQAREIPGFDAICRLLSEGGFPPSMGVEGLEPTSETRGKPHFRPATTVCGPSCGPKRSPTRRTAGHLAIAG